MQEDPAHGHEAISTQEEVCPYIWDDYILEVEGASLQRKQTIVCTLAQLSVAMGLSTKI